MGYRPDSGRRIQYTFFGRIMVIPKLKLVKGNNAYEVNADANETAPD